MDTTYLHLDIFGYRTLHFHYFLIRLWMRVDNHRFSALVISARQLAATTAS